MTNSPQFEKSVQVKIRDDLTLDVIEKNQLWQINDLALIESSNDTLSTYVLDLFLVT